jgi:purine nucleoside permease
MAAIPIKAVIVTAFEPATGPVPGEFRYWRERERMHQELHFAYAILPLFLSEDGVLGIVAGVGASRAAASIMALGLDPRFDLSRAFWLITGVCGVDPARGSLASVVLPEYIVEGDLAHEIDTREIPPGWPDGFVALGKSAPYEQPRADRFDCGDNLLYHLNSELVGWAHNLARDTDRGAPAAV